MPGQHSQVCTLIGGNTAIRPNHIQQRETRNLITTLQRFRPNIISLSDSNFMNTTEKLSNVTTERTNALNVAVEVSYIVTIIINSITCPFTVLLNVLVIMAVKRRPRLQTNANILLACLAVTDALTGLTSQPSFILWKTFRLHSMTKVVTTFVFVHS